MLSYREDVPEEVVAKFNHLFKQLPQEEQAQVNEALSKKFNHIKTYYEQAKQLATYNNQKYAQEAQAFIKYLESHYDYLYLRRGNEVILNIRDFLFSLI